MSPAALFRRLALATLALCVLGAFMTLLAQQPRRPAASAHPAGAEGGDPVKPAVPTGPTKTAVFAGGCFWCMQFAFDHVPGVVKTVVGYSGGHLANPSYEDVGSGQTGHFESIQVTYDPAQVTYEKLLDVFWKHIDPTAVNRQFADQGTEYQSVVFYQNDEEKRLAETSKEALQKSGQFDKPIATLIRPAGAFYTAEEYHQKYYQKNPDAFRAYEYGSGRAGYLRKRYGTDQ